MCCFSLVFAYFFDTLYLVVVVVVVIVFFCVFVTIVLQKITFFFPMCCCWCCCCCCCLRYLWWRWLKQTLFSQEKLYRNKVHETQNWCKNERELGYKHYPRVVQYLTSWWFLLFFGFRLWVVTLFFFSSFTRRILVLSLTVFHTVLSNKQLFLEFLTCPQLKHLPSLWLHWAIVEDVVAVFVVIELC